MAKKNQSDSNIKEADTLAPVFVQQIVPTIYANHAQMHFSNLDVTLILGEIQGQNEKGQTEVVPRVKIAMTHLFLGSLANLINDNLGAFNDIIRRAKEQSSAEEETVEIVS